jgi:hypothetical protein
MRIVQTNYVLVSLEFGDIETSSQFLERRVGRSRFNGHLGSSLFTLTKIFDRAGSPESAATLFAVVVRTGPRSRCSRVFALQRADFPSAASNLARS